MEKNLSYRAAISRPQAFRQTIDAFVLALCSWPRLLLEVFIRRNFGERYFSFSSAVLMTAVLAYYPIAKEGFLKLLFGGGFSYGYEPNIADIIQQNMLWYGYLAAFMVMAVKRRQEVQREPGRFDFARYSLSTGEIDGRLYELEFGGKDVTRRTIETLLEPGLFLFIGLLLWAFGQPLGKLLVLCAFIYGMSYRAMYRIGDNFVLDKIDTLILNRQMVNAFVDGQDASETQGFHFYGRRPADPDFRRELADRMIEKDEIVDAV
jgi:hypothetical protein